MSRKFAPNDGVGMNESGRGMPRPYTVATAGRGEAMRPRFSVFDEAPVGGVGIEPQKAFIGQAAKLCAKVPISDGTVEFTQPRFHYSRPQQGVALAREFANDALNLV